MRRSTEGSRKVLFIGRHGCAHSQKALQHLARLGCSTEWILSRSRRDALPETLLSWSGDYIFSYRSYFILPGSLLRNAAIAAINFHPGPAEYPGSAPVNWALYENAATFGATAHLMNEKVDSGPIIECRRFPIRKEETIQSLLAKAHASTFDLFLDVTTGLATHGESFLRRKLATSKRESWRGKVRTIRELEELRKISPDCAKSELDAIVRAVHTPEFPLEIELHGYTFVLKPQTCGAGTAN